MTSYSRQPQVTHLSVGSNSVFFNIIAAEIVTGHSGARMAARLQPEEQRASVWQNITLCVFVASDFRKRAREHAHCRQTIRGKPNLKFANRQAGSCDACSGTRYHQIADSPRAHVVGDLHETEKRSSFASRRHLTTHSATQSVSLSIMLHMCIANKSRIIGGCHP